MSGPRTPGALLLILWTGLTTSLFAQAPPPGFQPEVRVQQPTRLDWEFVVRDFPVEAAGVPLAYESARQRYQLYVPSDYDPKHNWPLVVFLSPGDDPLGWRYWQKPCQTNRMLFCAAYAAGNNTAVGQRTRLVLDMVDDVRRRYRIDPDQTYLAGFSGGARLACTLAFALPDYFGGVAAICGSDGLNRLEYLRLRVQDRLSVALITGPGDFNRREVEDYLLPYFSDLSIRTRLWNVPEMGHAMPSPEVLGKVLTWLAEDRPRRRAEARKRPALAVDPAEVATDRIQAARLLEAAEADLHHPEELFRTAALLRGIEARYGRTESASKAGQLLKDIQADPRRKQWLAEQTAAEEKRILAARAKGLERSGDLKGALELWGSVAVARVGTAEGTQAARELQRLHTLLGSTPYLGLNLEGESALVQAVIPRGPAEQAGLRSGDRLLKLGMARIASLADLRQALKALKPGDRVSVEVQRGGEALSLNLEIGRPPG